MAEPTFALDANGEEIHFWNCPVRFIPASVVDFAKRYTYHKRFPGAPIASYDEASERWVDAVRIYEQALSEGLTEKRKHG